MATIGRLTLARLLLESILTNSLDTNADWSAMSPEALQRDWDNDKDAIYDKAGFAGDGPAFAAGFIL